MIYLYIKQHTITGLKYFGKTVQEDPIKYPGSGVNWSEHIKTHGKDNIITIGLWLFYDQKECTEFALKFSEENNIVESKDWANKIPENALDGGHRRQGIKHTDQTKEKIRLTQVGRKHTPKHIAKCVEARKGFKHSDEFKAKMSKIHKNKIVSLETRQKIGQSSKNRVFSEETRQKISDSNKGKIMSEEGKRKISLANKNRVLPKSLCPHCNKLSDGGNYKRWHGDNCKLIT